MHDAIADLPVAVTALGAPAWAYKDVIVPDRGMLVGIITYKMVIWHPYLGGTKEQTVMIQLKIQAKVDVKIPAPTGRLYANEMVDKPYTRFGITDDAQSHIVPTVIRQER